MTAIEATKTSNCSSYDFFLLCSNGQTRVLVAYITSPGASSMAFLAPSRVPGPMRRSRSNEAPQGHDGVTEKEHVQIWLAAKFSS